MPEITVTPTAALANASSGANALAQGDGAVRGTEGAATSADGSAPSPFAATLKSHMEGGRPATEGSTAESASTQASASDDATVPVDLSAILSLLGIDPATLNGLAPTTGPTPGRTPTTSEDTATSLPVATTTAPEAVLATPVVAPVAQLAVATGRENAESASRTAGNEIAAAARDEPTPARSGNIGADAAISAEPTAPKPVTQTELPPDDFRTLIDRAIAAPATSAPPGTGTAAAGAHGAPLRVETPLGQAGWHEEVGQRLTWMVGNDSHRADLVLNPPELGRVEVSLSVSGDKASAVFASPNPAVREALEASMGRLREVLADAGVTLGQTHVGSETPGRSMFEERRELARGEHPAPVPMPATMPGRAPVAASGRGMIDVFA